MNTLAISLLVLITGIQWDLTHDPKAMNLNQQIPQNLEFKDTSGWLVFDDGIIELDTFDTDTFNTRMKRYFKFIRKEPLVITRAFTSDPHFICNYPKEPLVPGGIYSYSICFYVKGSRGRMHKVMGFDLSDKSKSYIRITGYCLSRN